MTTASKGFLVSSSVTLTSGTKIIEVTGDVDCSYVSTGTIIFLDGAKQILEGVSGTAANPLGKSFVTLRSEFEGETLTNVPMTGFNTVEGLKDAIRRARDTTDEGQSKVDTTQFTNFITESSESLDLDLENGSVSTAPYAWLVTKVKDLISKNKIQDLENIPSSLLGSKGKVLAITEDETGVEFVSFPEIPEGVAKSTDLSDFPTDLLQKKGKILVVSEDETGFELIPRISQPASVATGTWDIYIDVSETSTVSATLTKDRTTLLFDNVPTTVGQSVEVTVILKQGVGSGKVTWPESIIWQNGREPILSYQKDTENIVTFSFINGSPKPYGFFLAGWME